MYSTGITPWNSPPFVVASRFKNPSPRSLEDSCLAFSPFASLSRAAFGSSVPDRQSLPFERDSSPSFAFGPPSASLTRKSRRSPRPCSTKAGSFRPSLKLSLPSASLKTRNPSSHSRERLKDVGRSLRSPLLRVWLPSRGLASRVPRKLLPAPHALGILPSKLSSTRGSRKRFPFLSFVPALLSKTFSALNRRSDDFLPTGQLLSFFAP